jgi:hypothetical protein
MIEDAVTVYSTILSDLKFSQQKSRKEIDLEFGELIANHPERAQHIDAAGHLQNCLTKYPEEAATFWLYIASYHTRLG